MTTEGTAAVNLLQQGKDHKIFKSCICCGFDTLERPEWPRHKGLSYRCPNCDAPTFIMACSECLFVCSRDCPLIELLGKTHEVYLTEGFETLERSQGYRNSGQGKRDSVCEVKIDDATGKNNKRVLRLGTPVAPILTPNATPEQDLCPYCRKERWKVCVPAEMTLFIDMKEFSTLDASEFRLCTMCKYL
jgi:predicted RNA-binding Zn-ribbon protein involved in translation (DUF1610 family)